MNARAAAWLLLLACLAACAHASLQGDIGDLLAAPGLRYALVGIHIVDLHTAEVLYSRNSDVRMVPASNQKIITGAAAYDLLGPDFCWPTRVLLGSKPTKDGLVSGSLYLKGSGNPLLSHGQLVDLARRVHASTVRHITGDVIGDASAFSDAKLGTGWAWDYLDESYAAEISALTVDEGCVRAVVRGAPQAGKPPILRLDPPSSYLTLAPGLLTARGGPHNPTLHRLLGKNVMSLSGAIGINEQVEAVVSVREPALYCATLFWQALKKAGVEVGGQPELGCTSDSAIELLQTNSAPLAQVLVRLNRESDNLCAESLLRTISLVKDGRGTRERSVQIINRWVESVGGDSQALVMYDGSGLSRLNCVTPQLLVQILKHMWGREGWVMTLPVMGRDGSLASRLKGTAAEGKVRAKTGHLNGVWALSGYVHTKSGRRLAFSILVNNCPSKDASIALQNRVCLLLVEL